jgi:lysophospholipase L1-like esterase
MEHLPYELNFLHKYNIHKLVGLLIDDNDIRFIANIYGVKYKQLKKIEETFNENISRLADNLKNRFPVKPPLEKPVHILALGDSITSDRESYMKILKKLWKDDPSREFLDCGISGDTTSDVINRFYSTVVCESFDWAVIFLGTNDSRQLNDETHISLISLDEYKRNMKHITESLLDQGKKLVHITLPYIDNERFQKFFTDTNWIYDKKRIDKTNDFIRDLSKKHKTHLADLAAKIGEHKGDVLEKDGIHLNGDGQTLLCELLLDILP